MPKHKQAGHTTVLTKKTANIARKRLQGRSHPHTTATHTNYRATALAERGNSQPLSEKQRIDSSHTPNR
jgi:hypothetical protein